MVKESPLDKYFHRILVQLCKSLALALWFSSYDCQCCREREVVTVEKAKACEESYREEGKVCESAGHQIPWMLL